MATTSALPVREPPDRRPPDRHRAGDGSSSGQHEPVPGPGGGMGRRRTQPLHLLDLRHLRHATSRGATATRPAMPATRPASHAYGDASAGAGSTTRPVVARRGGPTPTGRATSARSAVRAGRAQRAARDRGRADVGIYASPGVWNSIVGDYQPSSRTGWPTTCRRPADRARAPTTRTGSRQGAQSGPPRDRAVRQRAVRRGLRLLADQGRTPCYRQ